MTHPHSESDDYDGTARDDYGRPFTAPCKHDYQRVGTVGNAVVYECRHCGDEYEKDVS